MDVSTFARARRGLGLAVVLAGMAVPATASAVPPSADQFQIEYFTTDADGSRGDLMNINDLQSYVNRARCECGQLIQARIRLTPAMAGEQVDNTQVRTFVGNRCAQGQNATNPQDRPCALGLDAFTQVYSNESPVITFQPIHLAHGVTRLNADVETAQSVGNCQSGQGNAGIWVCVEDGDQTDCQTTEFIIEGTQNNNVPEGEMSQGFAVDFQPPSVTVTGFEAEGGDGSLLVSWQQASATDVQGFRILCADANDNPLPGRGFRPSGPNYGQFYYTAGSVCPDGPFNPVPQSDSPVAPIPMGTSGGTDGGTGGDIPDSTGTGAALDGFGGGGVFAPEDCCQPNSMLEPGCIDPTCETVVCNTLPSCCDTSWGQACADFAGNFCQQCVDTGTTSTSGGTTSTTTTGGTGGGTDTTTGTGGDTDTATGGSGTDTTGGDVLPSDGIQSLDWAYVCSGHLPPTTTRARISGLDNGTQYQILVIAYDRAGNPTAASEVLTATPRETSDFWEQCEQQGNVCGNGGYCSCRADDPRPLGALGLLAGGLLGLGGVWRRRRRR